MAVQLAKTKGAHLVTKNAQIRACAAGGRRGGIAKASSHFMLAGFARESALYFGDHFFVAADEGGFLLVYGTKIEHHRGERNLSGRSKDWLA